MLQSGHATGATTLIPRTAVAVTDPSPDSPPALLAGRYRLGERFDARGGVERFHGSRPDANGVATPVVLVREPAPEPRATMPYPPRWPSLHWEEDRHRRVRRPGLPPIIDSFTDETFAYTVF